MRHQALSALGRHGARVPLEALAAAAQDESADVRERVVWALSEIADRSTR